MLTRSPSSALLAVSVTSAVLLLLVYAAAGSGAAGFGQQRQQDPLAQPFKGVTTNGTVVPGLFSIRATGVSTAPVKAAAEAFLATLSSEQRDRTTFPADDPEWRRWNNVHRADRLGISLKEMTPAQRASAFALLQSSLSARGFTTSRDIMRLNETIGEIRNNLEEYGEHLYWFTVMGTPSATEPWGWQLDGHHLIINYFVLGDQVVMTPTFMGSEPVTATTGKYSGTQVMQREERVGLSLMNALDERQRSQARIAANKTANNSLAQAYRDNLVLDYAGLKASAMNAAQKELLLAVVQEYVGNMPEGHARVRMEEVRAHLEDTWFAWIGGITDTSTFYYRVHSPVILVEFDHQTPVALPGPRVPGRDHIHSVVRTPNGNDYGKDLLRQHMEQYAGDPSHGHVPPPSR